MSTIIGLKKALHTVVDVCLKRGSPEGTVPTQAVIEAIEKELRSAETIEMLNNDETNRNPELENL